MKSTFLAITLLPLLLLFSEASTKTTRSTGTAKAKSTTQFITFHFHYLNGYRPQFGSLTVFNDTGHIEAPIYWGFSGVQANIGDEYFATFFDPSDFAQGTITSISMDVAF